MLRPPAFVVWVSVVAVAGIAASTAAAAPGDLDATFGTGGTVKTAFLDVAQAGSMVIQSTDGKIVAEGNTYSTTTSDPGGIAIARYNTDGTLDSGFGTGGKVVLHGSGASYDASGRLAAQGDGKLFYAACPPDPTYGDDLTATRLNTNGSVDTSYGTNGTASAGNVYGLTGDSDYCTVMAATVAPSDGKLLVLWRPVPERAGLYVTRFNSDGTLDTGFATGGTARITFVDANSNMRATYYSDMALQGDGKIVVATMVLGLNYGDTISLGLARLNANGTLDSGFGSAGKVMSTFAASVYGIAVAMAGDQILVGGGIWDQSRAGGTDDCALWRYNSDGSIDTTFGTGGLAQSVGPNPNGDCYITSMAVQGDGKIVGSGPALGRFNADGSPDTSFGSNGFVVYSPERINKIALQSDGKIVAAGWVSTGATSAVFLLHRWLAAAGDPTPGGGSGGSRGSGGSSGSGGNGGWGGSGSSGASPAAPAVLRMTSRNVKVVRGVARVLVTCTNDQRACHDTLTLTTAGAHAASGRAAALRPLVIGRTTANVPAGQRVTIRVRLNSKGRALLARAPHHRLHATLTIDHVKRPVVLRAAR
jgi:uncharacterized delta-60 repeat protein